MHEREALGAREPARGHGGPPAVGKDLNGRPVHENPQVACAVAGHGPLGSTAADGVVREAQRKLGAVPGDGDRVVARDLETGRPLNLDVRAPPLQLQLATSRELARRPAQCLELRRRPLQQASLSLPAS